MTVLMEIGLEAFDATEGVDDERTDSVVEGCKGVVEASGGAEGRGNEYETES